MHSSGNSDRFLEIMSEQLSFAFHEKYQDLLSFNALNLDLSKKNYHFVKELTDDVFILIFPFISKSTKVTETTVIFIDSIWTTQLKFNIGNYIIQTDITDYFPIVSQFKYDKQTKRP